MEESRSTAKEGGEPRSRPSERAALMSLVLTEEKLLNIGEVAAAGVGRYVGGGGRGGPSAAEELHRKSLILFFLMLVGLLRLPAELVE